MTPGNNTYLTDADRAALADAGLPVPTEAQVDTFMSKLVGALKRGITDWREVKGDNDEDV